MKNKYLIISPCFNIEKFASNHILQLKKNSLNCDILLIDDYSNDETLAILQQFEFQTISFKQHSGKASALKYGFSEAVKGNYEAVITIDSDFQHDHSSIQKFIETYEQSSVDYIVGKRSFSITKMPLSRIASNRLSSWILSRICGVKLEDSQCGFRMIDKRYLQLPTQSDGFQFESEHLVKSIWNGAGLDHINIPTIYNGAFSSMKYAKDTVKFIKLFWQLMRSKKVLIESAINEQA